MPPYLIQSDFAVLILAMEQRIGGLQALLQASNVQTTLSLYSDLAGAFQTAIGGTALTQYTALLTKLQEMQSLAPVS